MKRRFYGLARRLSILLAVGLVSEAKAQQYLTFALRSGRTHEVADKDYYGSIEMLHTSSWDQQLLLDIGLSKHFHLEPSIAHYRVKADLSGQKHGSTGAYYNKYLIANDVLRHQVLLQYSFVNRNRIKLSAGAGFGVHICYNRYDMTYVDRKQVLVADKNSLVHFEAISGAVAFTGKYQFNKKIDVNSQVSCFTFTNARLWGYNARIGVGYSIF